MIRLQFTWPARKWTGGAGARFMTRWPLVADPNVPSPAERTQQVALANSLRPTSEPPAREWLWLAGWEPLGALAFAANKWLATSGLIIDLLAQQVAGRGTAAGHLLNKVHRREAFARSASGGGGGVRSNRSQRRRLGHRELGPLVACAVAGSGAELIDSFDSGGGGETIAHSNGIRRPMSHLLAGRPRARVSPRPRQVGAA